MGDSMNWARIENNVAIEVTNIDPSDRFPAHVVWELVPDDVTPNSVRDEDGEWTIAEPAPQPEPAVAALESPKPTPVQFKLLWTSAERIGIKKLRPTDEVLDDFMTIVEDPRLTFVDLGLESNQMAVAYTLGKLAEAGIVKPEDVEARQAQILTGELK